MFGTQRLFSTDRGATTSWLAGVTSAALLVASIALPVAATDADPSAPPEDQVSETLVAEDTAAAEEAAAEEAAAEEAAAEEVAAEEEAVIGEPLEALAGDEEASEAPNDDAAAAAAETPASDPAPPAADEPKQSDESSAPAEGTKSPATSDGSDSSDNAPPVVEERVFGIKAVPGDGEITVYFPDFGFEDNYAVQVETKDGSFKTVETDVRVPKALYANRDVASTPPATADNVATVDGLKDDKTYTLRIISADSLKEATLATEPAVAAPTTSGRGSAARAALVSAVGTTPTATQELTVTTLATTSAASNPPLDLTKCGLNVAIVVDRSGSIGSTNMNLQKDALKGLMDEFVNTATVVSLISYSSEATELKDNVTIVTQADADSFDLAINGLVSSGWTNWEAGLQKVLDLSADPDLVLFLSDGRPNTVGTGASTSRPDDYDPGTDFSQTALDRAVVKANAIKAQGSRMLGIPIGDSANTVGSLGESSIIAVSGPSRYPGTGTIAPYDFVPVDDFGTLETQLVALAAQLCPGLDKSADKVTVAVGGTVTYTVTLTNKSAVAVTSDLVDVLPSGTTYKQGSTFKDDVASADPDGVQTLTWANVELAPAGSTTFRYTVDVAAVLADGTPLINNATWADEQDDVKVIVANPGIPGVKKSVDPSTVGKAGGDVVYTVTLSNTGGGSLTSDLVDVLPPGVTFKEPTGATPPPVVTGAPVTGQTLTWSGVTVDGGKEFVATYKVTVPADLADGTTKINSATWSGENAKATVTVKYPVPGVKKSVDPSTVGKAGGDVVYTVTLSNTGSVPATSDLVDVLPPGVTFKEPTGATPPPVVTGVPVTGQTLTWSGVTVDGGKEFVATYKVTVPADLADGTTKINSATWSGENAKATVTVNNPAIPGLEKSTTTASPLSPGSTVDYKVTLTNTGGAAVTSDLVDTLPIGLTYQSGSASTDPDLVREDKREIKWIGVTVNPGGTFTVTYTADVASDVADNRRLTNNAGWAGKDDQVTVVVRTGTVEVSKLDVSNESPLEGAVFQLWTAVKGDDDALKPGDKIGDPKTTDEFGKVGWGNLPWGDYFVQEVTAPAGYSLTKPEIQAVTIDASTFACDDRVQLSTVQNNPRCAGTEYLVFENEPLGDIEVLKIDELTDKPLEDAVFQLWTAVKGDDDALKPGEKIGDPKTTDEFGNVRWEQLAWGDYFVQEVTAPAGYALTKPAIQPAMIGLETFRCDEVPSIEFLGLQEIGAESPPPVYESDCTPGVVELTFANPPIDIPKLNKTSIPTDGTAVDTGSTITYTIKVSNEGALPLTGEKLVDTLPTGTTLDTASVTPAGDTSVAGKITWTFDLDGFSEKSFTYKVTVTAGFGSPDLVNSVEWIDKELTAKTEHPVKAVTATVTAFCVKDAPYYSLTITPQNGALFTSQVATVSWYQANASGQPIDAQGNPTTDPAKFVAAYDPSTPNKTPYVDTYTLTNGALSIPQTLWKGAAVDASGSATQWPGWQQPSPGVWVQVDSGGVRPGMFAVVSVNPTAQTAAVYPPAAAPCANPPGVAQLDKTADPAEGIAVEAGDKITYSVKATNTGGSEFTGPMVDTLPDGFIVDAASVTNGGVVSGNTITWQVTLAGGASATFSYSGTVDTDAAGELLNMVVLTTPQGDISDQTIHPVSIVEGVEEVDEPDEVIAGTEDLASTGANNTGSLVAAALLAMVAGGLMVTFGRRRRHHA